jgi:hypothetical protein
LDRDPPAPEVCVATQLSITCTPFLYSIPLTVHAAVKESLNAQGDPLAAKHHDKTASRFNSNHLRPTNSAAVAGLQFIVMSVDPYHEVQSEIQSSLQTAEQLRASFLRIRSTARDGNEELEWARSEVSCRELSVRPHLHVFSLHIIAESNALGS